jgi:hypothetical protein
MFMLKRFILAASLLVFCTPSLVNACLCAVGGGKCDQSWNYGQVIVTGTVTRRLLPTDVFSRRVFQLSVSESFRGPAIVGQEISVYTGAGGGDCGYPFEVGASYLVYAHLVGDRLVTSICSHTNPVSQTTHFIRQLRALQNHERAADLFGMVRRLPSRYTARPEITLLEGRRVRVIGSNNFEQSATTDQEGVFSFPTLPADTYRIEVDPPPEGMTNSHLNMGRPLTVEIGATQVSGCTAMLSFAAAGGIKGRVVNEYGSALAGLVTLEPADPGEAEVARRRSGLSSSKTDTGDFQLWLSVPGQYRLIYHPKAGMAAPVSSEVIKVNFGEFIEDFRFKVPAVRQ